MLLGIDLVKANVGSSKIFVNDRIARLLLITHMTYMYFIRYYIILNGLSIIHVYVYILIDR